MSIEYDEPQVDIITDLEQVSIAAARLMDPEDRLINEALNGRGYRVRVCVTRDGTLMIPDWLDKVKEAFDPQPVMISLDFKPSRSSNSYFDDDEDEEDVVQDAKSKDDYISYGTRCWINSDCVCICYVSSQGQVFFHFWCDNEARGVEYAKWIQTMYVEKQTNVLNEKKNTRTLTFWGHTGNDYESFNRRIPLLPWDEHMQSNYPASVREQLETLTAIQPPVLGGRIILLYGDPGTGKTTFIRTLARVWSAWCHTADITDPEVFLGNSGALLKVITYDYNQYIDKGIDRRNAYQLLVIEDADELVSTNAKNESGQKLSRLLNLSDGLIGQSTNVLIVISTNKPMAELHQAVSRAGRCLAKVEFTKFEKAEATEWLAHHHPDMDPSEILKGSDSVSLAELYERTSHFKQITHKRKEEVFGTYL